MAYLGNTSTTQSFIPAIDYFNGNGSTTAFTLSKPVASVAQIQVTIDNVAQNPSSAYSVLNNTITFTSAPLAGTNNIYVYYTSPITQVIAPGQGTVSTTQLQSGLTVNFADGTAAAPSITNDGDTNTGIFFPAADTIAFAEGGAEIARFDSSGNLGIGVTPSYRLEVKGPSATAGQLSIHDGTGDTVVSGTNAASLLFQCRDSSVRTIAEIDGVHTTTNGTGGAIVFQTRNSDVLAECGRFANDGSFLVGTTTNVGANAKIFALGSGKGIAVGYGTGSSAYRHLYMNNADATLYFFNDTNYASLSSAGAWTNASDARLKKNIVNIKYGLADVLRLQPRSYQMNDVAGNFVGFVAQELQTVIPEVVSGDPEKQLGVDYGSLVAVAFKAIQEQQALITSLTARIEALENK